MKKISLLIIVLATIVIASFVYHRLHIELTEKASQEKTENKKSKEDTPSNYCLITYKVSSDDEKTWRQVVINSGQEPTYKAKCWKKYLHILDGFSSSIPAEGKWHSKARKGKTIKNPSMQFSTKPFDKLAKIPNKDKSKSPKKPNKS